MFKITIGIFLSLQKPAALALDTTENNPNRCTMAEKKSKLAEIKTKPTVASVEDFINTIPEEQKRKDSFVILEMMKEASGEEPVLWGSSLIGFGTKRYKSAATGREVDWLKIGFSPRKANLSLYISVGIAEHAEALKKLGKHKTGVGCLYINKLADVDLDVLKGMIAASLDKK
ncbi:hypothetical protein GGR22_002120 [Flavobacterium gossypii]|uniref:YdhG-like domain-containing protein n=2 Tax=Flavobacterium TaxID=237 RepID=A0ABR6DQI8_9FLAO|nr:DUF1801 domain-containing protein [Flavobacterium gossypii]MBA9073953.1 hypothetical protein [Flavobacterium gossypii]